MSEADSIIMDKSVKNELAMQRNIPSKSIVSAAAEVDPVRAEQASPDE